jgi:UDP-N-acetyl-2-amino-2-deoxyglucuronate dehydrogenase
VGALKQALDEGRLGRIVGMQLNCFWNRDAPYYAGDWKGTRELDGGILYTQFSHFIDLAVWLLGDLRRATAFAGNFMHAGVTAFEDGLVAAVEFRSGTLGTMHFTTNAHGRNMEGSLTLFGEKGTVKVGGQYLNELEYQRIDGYRIEGLPEGGTANDYGTYQGSMSNHHLVYDNVADVLLRQGVITTSAFDGLKTVDAIEKLYGAVR